MSVNADPNAFFYYLRGYENHQQIKTLSAASINFDRKSPNSLIKSVWCLGGLYTIAYTNITGNLSLIRFSLEMLYEAPLLQRSYT